ncbi:hypothetical protein EVAR_67821_1 [Eumeta japonica]|uniref:Uncharacterized protein n=1 Tax=Eumeta variegata TaxID=151549 RepID=A0A4C1ZQU0_EUMVA|nr:hypothetical protein EVAR_67821_1 [Eumeta japonica]
MQGVAGMMTDKNDGRFKVGLLWRNDDIYLPNNYDAAMNHLVKLERRLDRDSELKKAYLQQMQHMVQSRYAVVTPESTTPNRTWYMLHFAVVNLSKPKPRIVHDAAAKAHDTNLSFYMR